MGAQHGCASSDNGPTLSMGTSGSPFYMGHSVLSRQYELSELLDEVWHPNFILLVRIENAAISSVITCNYTKEVLVLHPFRYATWPQAYLTTDPWVDHWRSSFWGSRDVGDYLASNIEANLSPTLKLARGREPEATVKRVQMWMDSLQAPTRWVM